MTPEAIFITSRFRSGSTLLWNMYDRTSGYRAFYEPCHDNLREHIRHTRPMTSHLGVGDYWESYRSLLDDVEAMHRPEFGLQRLVLDADDDWPELEAYVRCLIERSAPAIPVLQFNRMDFRLPWLRARFPSASIVHLQRPVRDVWASMISHLPADWIDRADEPHVYDLLEWSAALAPTWPFLADPTIRSLYERHFVLWTLSSVMGERLADCRLDLVRDFRHDPVRGLTMLADAGLFPGDRIDEAVTLIDRTERPRRSVVPLEGFDRIETRWTERLTGLGFIEDFGLRSTAEMMSRHADAWTREREWDPAPVIDALLAAYSRTRGEVTRLLDQVQSP